MIKLGKCLTIKHGWAFKGEFFAGNGKQSILTPGNFYEAGGFKYNDERERYYIGEYPPEYLCKKGDLIVAMTEQAAGLLGSTAIVPKDYRYLHNQRIGLVTCDEVHITKMYAYYLFMTKSVREQISRTSSGTKVKHTSPEKIYDVEVSLPDITVQKKIAHLLWTIDDKIRNNNHINDNLEHQLKLMYDYWFTQFDFPDENGKPYRSSGGAMVWNEQLKREIPVGWECKTLGELLVKNTDVFDFKRIEPTIDLSVMPSASISLQKLNSSDQFTTNLFIMHEGDILFGSIRPYLKKAGIAPCNGVVAGTVYSYRTREEDDYNFVLFTLCRDSFFEYALSVSTGTKMPVVSSDSILSYKIPYSSSVAKHFNEINVRCIICKNNQEVQRLSKLRDWLLPMLMNGQISIMDEHEEKPQIKVSGFEQWIANQGFAARGDVDIDVLKNIYEAMDDNDK